MFQLFCDVWSVYRFDLPAHIQNIAWGKVSKVPRLFFSRIVIALLKRIRCLLVPDGHPVVSSELVNDPFAAKTSETAVLLAAERAG